MALDVAAARARRRRQRRASRSASAARKRRAASSPSLDNNMMGAMRIVSVERGHDPRDFTLVPFGGAGPLHGCALAELLGITPRADAARARRALRRRAAGRRPQGRVQPHPAADRQGRHRRGAPIYAELSRQADDWLAKEKRGAGRPQAGARRPDALSRPGRRGFGRLGRRRGGRRGSLRRRASERSTASSSTPPIELVTLRIEATGRMPAPLRPGCVPALARSRKAGTPFISPRERPRCRCYDRATFGAGDRFEGPAIITQLDATTLVAPGWSGEVHPSGAILLTHAILGTAGLQAARSPT